MPTQALFDKYPPFPKDIEAAQLRCISYSKLLSNDESESKALLSACQHWGFFLLNFCGCPEGELYIQQAAELFDVNEEVHSMGVQELMRYYYNTPRSLFGYKPPADTRTTSGARDRFAFYNISKDSIISASLSLSTSSTAAIPATSTTSQTSLPSPLPSPLSSLNSPHHSPDKASMRDLLSPLPSPPLPPYLRPHLPLITSYIRTSHSIISLLSTHLSTQLGLPPSTLSDLQPLALPSGTALRLLHYPPQPPNDQRPASLAHTDIGTLTILWAVVGGLQILPPKASSHTSSTNAKDTPRENNSGEKDNRISLTTQDGKTPNNSAHQAPSDSVDTLHTNTGIVIATAGKKQDEQSPESLQQAQPHPRTSDLNSESDSKWLYVPPRPGCAIVNLGDAMVEWTGGKLKSCLHRVTVPPGEQAMTERYSMAYLCRPWAGARMEKIGGMGERNLERDGKEVKDGEVMTAREWERFKAEGIQEGRDCARG